MAANNKSDRKLQEILAVGTTSSILGGSTAYFIKDAEKKDIQTKINNKQDPKNPIRALFISISNMLFSFIYIFFINQSSLLTRYTLTLLFFPLTLIGLSFLKAKSHFETSKTLLDTKISPGLATEHNREPRFTVSPITV